MGGSLWVLKLPNSCLIKQKLAKFLYLKFGLI